MLTLCGFDVFHIIRKDFHICFNVCLNQTVEHFYSLMNERVEGKSKLIPREN